MPLALLRAKFGLATVVYLVTGAIVASTHHYYDKAENLRAIGSAALSVVLWPLPFLGVDLHIRRSGPPAAAARPAAASATNRSRGRWISQPVPRTLALYVECQRIAVPPPGSGVSVTSAR